jgi:ribosomal-protein-alanine N-acetyltransferase
MMDELVMAPVVESLLNQVLVVERACFKDPWPRSAFGAELEHSWSWFMGIGRSRAGHGLEQLSGFIICWMLSGEMHLLNLAVHPDQRRQGLARRMLQAALRAFGLSGGGLVSLEVRPSNQAAQALYRQFGFVQVGVRKGYYRKDNEDALVWIREVSAELDRPVRIGSDVG